MQPTETDISQVAAELEAQQINPIAADALVLDTMLERAFDCAQEVKSKQMALTVEQGERDAETEEAFFAGILFQRDQVSISRFAYLGYFTTIRRIGCRN